MKKNQVKKLALAGMFCAVAVVGSLFSFPVFGSKCAPIQHMVNILCAVLLGPWYGLGVAFAASLIRNLLGLGSLMAFPGSMFGALICGLIYKKSKNIPLTLVGEVGLSARRPLCISRSRIAHGQKCLGCCFLRIYNPVLHLNRSRLDYFGNYCFHA